MRAIQEIKLDFQREGRIGFEEAIYAAGKSPEHLAAILDQAVARGARLLLTRLSREQLEALPEEHRGRLDWEPLSRTAYFGAVAEPTGPARIAVVAAGTSDAFVSREVSRTLRYHGEPVTEIVDVGVAGLWRLLERLDEIRRHPVVVCVAGMDAALPTVLGGLVGSVVIAVPTSVGYGVAEGGKAGLHAVLASCAPGLLATNIDNGYGAACAALRVARAIGRRGDAG
jgi:NCAIR mutase (PurE)-related protein